jgi:hypothetical protein
MTYLDSGYNENLIRNIYPSVQQVDNVNIGDLIGNGVSIPVSGVDIQADNIKDWMIETLSVAKLIAGTINVIANIGDANVKIDGEENRMVINDGTNDRVLIGKLAGKF